MTQDGTASLTTLLYVSQLAPAQPAGTVADIATQARHNNLQRGVRGLLIFDGLWFAQWLEGPRPVLDRLRQQICADRRHTEVEVLAMEPSVSPPRYPDWALGYASLADEVAGIERLREYRGALALDAFQNWVPRLGVGAGNDVPANVVLRRLTHDLRDLHDKSRAAIDQSSALLWSLRQRDEARASGTSTPNDPAVPG